MKTLRFFIVILFFSASSISLFAEKLVFFTEEFPPYNYTQDLKHQGVSVEILEAMMKKVGMKYKIISLPWARAYKRSQEKENSFIFSITRNAKRENSFKWIGSIVPSIQSVYALKNRADIKIERLEDLKNYQIGTTINDSRETYLLEKGFNLNDFQRVAGKNSYLQNYKKLKKQRIDLWPINNAVMNYLVDKTGDDPKKVLRKVFEFSEISSDGFYIAASLSTKPKVVEKMRKVLEDLKKTTEYQMILKKWGFN